MPPHSRKNDDTTELVELGSACTLENGAYTDNKLIKYSRVDGIKAETCGG